MNAVHDQIQGKAVCGYYGECRAVYRNLPPSCGVHPECPAIRNNRPALDGYYPAKLAVILFSFFSNLPEEERYRILGEYWLRVIPSLDAGPRESANTPPASR